MIQVRVSPIGAADFHGFTNGISEGTKQIRYDELTYSVKHLKRQIFVTVQPYVKNLRKKY